MYTQSDPIGISKVRLMVKESNCRATKKLCNFAGFHLHALDNSERQHFPIVKLEIQLFFAEQKLKNFLKKTARANRK